MELENDWLEKAIDHIKDVLFDIDGKISDAKRNLESLEKSKQSMKKQLKEFEEYAEALAA